ncbi:hypothetical protein ASG67_01340 [Sphingomonas sp. Leaf339]|nr:hypothetical protein ASG67_01340 [Sphingomonas sp. Leaf339]
MGKNQRFDTIYDFTRPGINLHLECRNNRCRHKAILNSGLVWRWGSIWRWQGHDRAIREEGRPFDRRPLEFIQTALIGGGTG